MNFVLVPVTVKDESGRLVDGLLRKDFAVYEEGVKQNITVFTSDPFPLSAAVILDTGMPDVALRKVNQTFPALQAAFGQFDEVSLYTYGNTVKKVLDFSGLNQRLDVVLRDLKENEHGTSGGVPVIGGPINSGPTINGRPADPGAVVMNTPVIPSHVLNDAVLTAALDLSKRDPTRRKVIFIISDGHDWGSSARYNDVLKMLLSRNIAVYAVGVDSAAIPGYNTLEKIRLPRFGSSNILPKYASATGAMSLLNFPGRPLKAPTLNSRDRPVISTLSDTTREPLLAVLIAPLTFVSCVAASRFTPRMVTIRYRRPDSRYRRNSSSSRGKLID